ncbi:MAG: CaiB/BaiF CoA-transferase family protein [Candidatus Microthrix parvicella]|jgi:crotonobetainyl-CoA:carnitine CoA-transferase CaiB-like acyl-CoA transferase
MTSQQHSDRTTGPRSPHHAADGRSPFAGRPLDGLVVLALEQMAALPFATQLMGRLGARVIKVEHPVDGESGRQSQPSITDPQGRTVGATFLRSNLGKDSVGIDLKSAAGRRLVLELASHADVIAENFKPGTLDRLGLGPKVLADANPSAVLVSVSGFGSNPASPYRTRPAYASIVEGMSGIYEFKRHGDEPLHVNPVGALGDISAGLFAVIGVLAALRQRDVTGEGQHVDVAMLDSVLAMTDVVTNFASLGQASEPDPAPYVLSSFRTADGSLVIQLVREHQFARLAELIGYPEWVGDPRFAERTGWGEHLDDVIRPALEAWAAGLTREEAAVALADAGVVAGSALTPTEVLTDPHVAARNMLVAMDRPDGVDAPVLTPGNPVKLSRVPEQPERRVPWVGEHTGDVLVELLGLTAGQLDALVTDGVISGGS